MRLPWAHGHLLWTRRNAILQTGEEAANHTMEEQKTSGVEARNDRLYVTYVLPLGGSFS
jgi:hypothetical protein